MTKRLNTIGFTLGLSALVVSVIVIYFAYTSSIEKAEKNLYKYYSAKTEFLNAIIEINKDKSEKEILQLIEKGYNLADKRPVDEYICIIDKNANLVLHTKKPETVGNYIGNNPLTGKEETTLKDLVLTQSDYTGGYVSSTGQHQITAFKYVSFTKWIIGVHRSEEKLHEEIKSQYHWIIVALYIIGGGVFPLSLALLFMVSLFFHRKKIAIEIKNKEQLKVYNNQLKRAKERAEDNESKFKKLSNLTFEGIIIHKNGVIIDVNQSFEKMFFYTLDEVVGKNVFELFIPEQYHAVVSEKIKNNYIYPYEIEAIRKDGTTFPVELEAKVIENQLEKDTLRVAAVRDISFRKKAAEELKENKFMLSEAQRIGKIGSWEYDLLTEKPIWSDELFNMFKLEPNEVEATFDLYADFIHPDDRKMVVDSYNESVENKSPYDIEHRFRLKDGTIIYVVDKCETYYDKNGKAIRSIGMVQDITESKKTEGRLLNALKKAEESDHLKSAFLANMSHEIRTPMNGILGFSELLKEPGRTWEERQEYIDIIELSGKRMLTTLGDIIDISRIEAGQMDISISDVSINKQIKFLYAFFNPEAEQKGIHLSVKTDLSNDASIVKIDLEKFNSILTNLIKNAIKYTKKGSIEFGYNLNKSKSKNQKNKKVSELEFFVKDTGIGISIPHQEVVFDQFIRADIENINAYEGSGLGLAISKAYVEMLGGKIGVKSKEGEGSEFYFTLPYRPFIKELSKSPEPVVFEKPVQTKKINILIAEDNELASKHLTYILKNKSKKILLAENGKEAVELCRNTPDIDLILMDIQMPELNGYEATKQIRTFNTEVIIIAQTAYALLGDREKALEAGCNDYIPKPTDRQKLFKLIDKHVKV